jgi:LPXTG-motif cell wall-anchored protein
MEIETAATVLAGLIFFGFVYYLYLKKNKKDDE